MKSLYPYFSLLCLFIFSCKKDKNTIDPPVEVIADVELIDTSRVSLFPNFEKYLIEKGIDPISELDGIVLYKYIKDVDSLHFDVPIEGSTSLKGIEGFTNLRYFKSEGLMVDTLDFSKNTKLEHFEYLPYAHCMTCASLKILNFGKISSLQEFELRGTSVSSLDLTQSKMLRSVTLYNNMYLKKLDLSISTFLEKVYALEKVELKLGSHPKLVELTSSYTADVSKSPALEKWELGVVGSSGVDVSHNPELKSLLIYEITSPALDLTACSKLTNLEVYGHGDWAVTRLDLSKNKILKYCKLLGTGLSTICVSSLTETDFTYWEKDAGASYVKCN